MTIQYDVVAVQAVYTYSWREGDTRHKYKKSSHVDLCIAILIVLEWRRSLRTETLRTLMKFDGFKD